MARADELAREAIRICRQLAACSEEPGVTTRTFLSPPMREVHARLAAWMTELGMETRVDPAGNLRGIHRARPGGTTATIVIGSHLDTVPNAGAFDGVLGVVLGISLVEMLQGARLPFAIEVIGFSDEEGVRFGVPFIGSRAFVGTLDAAILDRRDELGRSIAEALRDDGHELDRLADALAATDALGYLELHIEQGPVLETLDLPIGIVRAIVGQTRLSVTFTGQAGHAGTTPMVARQDALAAAAEWTLAVERDAIGTPGLVATVSRIDIERGATNVIAGRATAMLDVRHADDAIRSAAVDRLCEAAQAIAGRRRLTVASDSRFDQPAVAMDPALVARLSAAVAGTGVAPHTLTSGAGHDAMIVAGHMPAAMLFVRSPGGISHHPEESVRESDVATALAAAHRFLVELG